MGKTIIKRLKLNKLSIIVLCLFIAYGDSRNVQTHNNINVYSKEQISNLINESVPHDIKTIPLTKGVFPIGGTVSYHLLVSPAINAWFRELKKNRTGIKTFIIISPNHYRSGYSNIALSYYDWNTAGNVTRVNIAIARSIQHNLSIKEDNLAFYNEHGIEVMLPFINHYFPEADIVPILVDEKRKYGGLNSKLADEICRIVKKNKDVFLVISADFSHNFGRRETDKNDARSQKSLVSLRDSPFGPCSDNTTGLMILYRVCGTLGIKNTHIFCHTDAEKYTSIQQGKNITSYFFTYQF